MTRHFSIAPCRSFVPAAPLPRSRSAGGASCLSALVAHTFLVVGCQPFLTEQDPRETREEVVEEQEEQEEQGGLGVLGFGAHEADSVRIDVIASRDDGLRGPRDLAFNPAVPGELWIVNRTDDSVVTITDTGSEEQSALKRIDPFALHFMEEVSSISFSTDMTFGTCQESRNTYNGQAQHNDFMGPTLWSADPDVFARTNPEAVADNDGYDLGSHLDMLHNSPLCMGIAWEKDNIYWTFDGLHGVISRYDFAEDHGPGFDDHADGVIERFVDVDVLRVADVPSHMVFDRDEGLLYVADTGNARVNVLDPSTAIVEKVVQVHENSPMKQLAGATWTTVVGTGLQAPSGLALADGVLYVGDNATGRISAFTLDGELIDYLDTGLPAGALMGIRVYEGALYVVDHVGEQVLRIRAKE